MPSKLKVVLLFSFLFCIFPFADAGAGVIKRVRLSGFNIFDKESVSDLSFLKEGEEYSDSLVEREINRLDSLYFSIGRLTAEISVDTLHINSGIDIDLKVFEGEQTRIGEIKLSGDKSLLVSESRGLNGLKAGDAFFPENIRTMMNNTMDIYNNSGFPFAQIWLTDFRFKASANVVDISFSIISGQKAVLSEIIFDGLTRTDSSVAAMAAGVKIPKRFSEEIVKKAAKNLAASGLFKSVGKESVNRNGEGKVALVFPVEEKKNNNYFQGMFGFSRKDNNEYEMNGRVDIQLDNIAGTGRKAGFSWFNDGRKYSETNIKYHEPFLFSTQVAISFAVKQVVEDSLYNMQTGTFELKLPFGPWGLNTLVGFSGDINVIPSGSELRRSVRQRYRLGMEKTAGSVVNFNGRIEGGRKKNYKRDGEIEIDWQYMYSFNFILTIVTVENQSVFCKMVSEGIFSDGGVHIAEMFPMGGAKTLRGFRESQFRGERVNYFNLEYRFGGQNRIFLFDDVGTYYRETQGWKLKNGFGFGIRTVSDLGTVELSFGMAGRLSMDEARIHVSLIETF
jgi:outer membrane protein assembly factor BamA